MTLLRTLPALAGLTVFYLAVTMAARLVEVMP